MKRFTFSASVTGIVTTLVEAKDEESARAELENRDVSGLVLMPCTASAEEAWVLDGLDGFEGLVADIELDHEVDLEDEEGDSGEPAADEEPAVNPEGSKV